MITEPATLATDYALSALTAWFAWRLHHRARQTMRPSACLWALAFVATAIGSFAGGTYHGFLKMLSPAVSARIWTIATIAVGAAACLLLSAVIVLRFRGALQRTLLMAVWTQFAAYCVWMLVHDDFVYVIVEYGSAMLAVLMLTAIKPPDALRPARTWIVAGIAGTLAAAAIQQSGFDLHKHFNHNDLQHVVQMFGAWFLYKGAFEAG